MLGTRLPAAIKLVRLSALTALSFAALALAGCSSQFSHGFSPDEYGVTASARVVAMGDPVPSGGGIYRVGQPYRVHGVWYYPQDGQGYSATGIASWYGDDFHGRRTANGEVYNMYALSAAHPTLPMPCYARVTNTHNGRSVVVRINDRGPYYSGRVIDLSKRAAMLLGVHDDGIGRVKVDYIGKAPIEGHDDQWLVSQVRDNGQPLSPQMVAMLAPVPAWAGETPVQQSGVHMALSDTLPPDEREHSAYNVASLNSTPPPAAYSNQLDFDGLPPPIENSMNASPLALIPSANAASAMPMQAMAPSHAALAQIIDVGTFRDAGQAVRYRDALQKFGQTSIEMTKLKGVTFYQVKMGPFSEPARAQIALHEAQHQGAIGARLLSL